MIPVIELDEDRDVWVVTELRYEEFIPAPKLKVLSFPEPAEELMRCNLLVA